MKKPFGLGVALLINAVGGTVPSYAVGVCSTGHYDSCVTCCHSNPTVHDADACARQCTQIKDSPLRQLIEQKKAKAAH
jgi:hypothetical protein